MKPLRSLDLFSGYGGLTLGLLPWLRPAAYCEIDPFAQAVLIENQRLGRLPQAPIVKDVRKISAAWLRTLQIEAIAGGFPCQDISAANPRGRGLDGARSGLFYEVARLTDLVRPRIVFLENVPTLAVRGLDRVLAEFARLGYDAEWADLSAAAVGAVHRRSRIWILAYAPSSRRQARLAKDDVPHGVAGFAGLQRSFPLPAALGPVAHPGSGRWASEPRIRRVDDGRSDSSHRIRALGNGVVPPQAEAAFAGLIKRAMEAVN